MALLAEQFWLAAFAATGIVVLAVGILIWINLVAISMEDEDATDI